MRLLALIGFILVPLPVWAWGALPAMLGTCWVQHRHAAGVEAEIVDLRTHLLIVLAQRRTAAMRVSVSQRAAPRVGYLHALGEPRATGTDLMLIQVSRRLEAELDRRLAHLAQLRAEIDPWCKRPLLRDRR
ncbi:MAG: hypothetical protein AAF281_17530 [Pseudomonadota bacterium]